MSIQRRCGGFTLLEAVFALTIFGVALVVASGALNTHAVLARRLEVRQQVIHTAEAVLETMRGGALPLQTGPIVLDEDIAPPGPIHVATFVTIDQLPQPDLYMVVVKSQAPLIDQVVEIELKTMMWRP